MDAVAEEFTTFYYTTFDSNRASLMPLYRDASMVSWEGKPFQGVSAIVEKLTSLPFSKVSHQITTRDVQPSSESNMIVFVTGDLNVDDSPPVHFTQIFHLVAEGGSYYILNDIFRLIYG